MKRRELVQRLAALGLGPAPLALLAARPAPYILWRNGWNTNNIGHVPGVLALLRRYIPEARVTLRAHNDLVLRGDIARRAGFADGAVDAGSVSRKVYPGLRD